MNRGILIILPMAALLLLTIPMLGWTDDDDSDDEDRRGALPGLWWVTLTFGPPQPGIPAAQALCQSGNWLMLTSSVPWRIL